MWSFDSCRLSVLALASVFALSCISGARPSPTTDVNIAQLVREYAAAISSGDADRFVAQFTDDCEFEDVPFKFIAHGKSELRAFAVSTYQAIPDFHMEVRTVTVADSMAVAEWVQSGTQRGPLGSLVASGTRYSVKTASILEFRGGKIRRVVDYWDLATTYRQLGHLKEDFLP